MRALVRLAVGAGAVVGLAIGVAPIAAGAAPTARVPQAIGGDHAVFVQTDNPAGNQVVAYDRANDGSLTLSATYNTGGLGGILNGSAVDHLASQGSLTYDDNGLLFAVNAGSNTVSVFSVNGDHLLLRQVINSGGRFPVSVAARGDLVYVLNAKGGGSVVGFAVRGNSVHRLAGSRRDLGLTIPTGTTQFTNTPGQVAFTPDGLQLVVTTKANGNDIDVFRVGATGRLSPAPVVNSEPGTVPFGVIFDRAGHLVVAEAGPNALATFALQPNGHVTLIDMVGTGQAATCWVAPAQGYLFASNAGSASESGYREALGGRLTLLGSTPTDPGTVDAAPSFNGRFLYIQTGGAGIVDGFAVHANGTLAAVGSVSVSGAAGGEGIVAF
jgi:6-phosphogluconolactonase (cycloisomerase 2 family)